MVFRSSCWLVPPGWVRQPSEERHRPPSFHLLQRIYLQLSLTCSSAPGRCVLRPMQVFLRETDPMVFHPRVAGSNTKPRLTWMHRRRTIGRRSERKEDRRRILLLKEVDAKQTKGKEDDLHTTEGKKTTTTRRRTNPKNLARPHERNET